MAKWTVLGVFEDTGKVFRFLTVVDDEGTDSDQAHVAIGEAAEMMKERNLEIVAAIKGYAGVFPPCEDSGKVAHVNDLQPEVTNG